MAALLVLQHNHICVSHAHYRGLLAAREIITILHRVYSLFSEVVYYGWGYTSLHLVPRRLEDWRLQAWHLFVLRCHDTHITNITSIFAPAMNRYRESFLEYSCPLCQQDVDILQPDFYRALPLNLERIAIFSERPIPNGSQREWNAGAWLKFRDLTVGSRIMNVHKDIDKIWLLHNRCLSFVDYLPPQKLHLLFDLVEPTWTSRSNPPKSQHGAFYAHSRPIFHDSNSEPASTVSRKRRRRPILQRALGFICQCIIPQIEEEDGGRPSLPAEIWDLVLQDDLGRLLFIMKTAAQIAKLDFQFRPPKRRFTVVEFHLTSPVLQVHVITIGERSYIANLSNRVDFRLVKDTRTICLDVSSSAYLATKTDGIGVVDIAVEEQDGLPKWALSNHTKPFTMEISQIRDADLRSLRLVRDVSALFFSSHGHSFWPLS